MELKSNKIGKNLSYYPLTNNEGYYEVEGLAGVKFLAEGSTPSTQEFDIHIDGLPMNQVELPRFKEVLDTLGELKTETVLEKSLINKWYVGMDKYLVHFESQVVGQLKQIADREYNINLELLQIKIVRDDYRKMTRIVTLMNLFFLGGLILYMTVDHNFGMVTAFLANLVTSIALFKYGKETKFKKTANVVRNKTPELDVSVTDNRSDTNFYI